MIRFSQTFGAHAGRVVELDKDHISFGRMPDCDVAFDAEADLDASGHHADVRRLADGWHVIDGESRNGTWLNGQKVQRAVLSSGDELEFGMGGPRLKVEILGVRDGVASPGQITGPMTPAPGSGVQALVTPVPRGLGAVDGSAATVAAMATPVPVAAAVMPVSSLDPPTRVDGKNSHGPPTPIVGGVGPAAALSAPMAPPQSGPKQYGQHTVGLMIDAALAQQADQSRPGRSTEEIRAIAASAAAPTPGPASSSGALKWAVALLMLLLGLVMAGAGVFIWYLLPAAEDGPATVVDAPAVNLEAARIAITAQSAAAMYVLVEEREGVDRGICVAFAVRPDLLATSAACVLEIEAGREGRASHFAIPNGGGGRRLPIVRMGYHPSFVPGPEPSADVGIVHLAAVTTVQTPVASMTELGAMAAGDPIFIFGFPAGLADVAVPIADLAPGTLTALTAFDGAAAPFPTSQLLRHGLPPSPGTRGSPIFDASGRVVGVSAGAYGVRTDLLASLLAGMQR
ncbi:MAG: FHA domain-containing protein [Deltaproteobacteria bacterium]|nr:FHA domain-containing protein [Deltaproteobacteria bacterium]